MSENSNKIESEKPSCDIISLHQTIILGEDGQQYRMGNLWQERTAILIFLRHFACVACRAHAVDVWKNRNKYEQSGAQIYFIGNGAPFAIKAFKEDLDLQDAWIFTDPTLKSFHHAGFKRGFVAAYGPRALKNIVQMYKSGHRDGVWNKTKGDLWQVGGILAVKPNSKVAYHYISQVQGDFPPEEDINDTPWISREKSKAEASEKPSDFKKNQSAS